MPKQLTEVPDGWIGIYTAQDLYNIRFNRDAAENLIVGKYIQMADIDLEGVEWLPIGHDYDPSFGGVYDGNGYKIINLYSIYGDNSALFGSIEDATIKNVSILNGFSSCGPDGNDAALLVCETYGHCKIVNCHAKGKVVGGYYGAGGLICYDFGSSLVIENSSFEGVVDLHGYDNHYGTGGLLYISWSDSLIVSNCYVNAEVYSSDYASGVFIGAAEAYSNKISRCYAIGTIKTLSDEVTVYGGFIGSTGNANIDNCFSNVKFVSNIAGVSSGYYFGSFLGDVYNTTITNCYAIADVSNHALPIAGLIPNESISDTAIVSSYFDKTVHNVEDIGGRTTEQMKKQATFINWDFDNVWMIAEGVTYPFFGTIARVQCNSFALDKLTVN